MPFLPADRWRRDTGSNDARPLVFVAKAKGSNRVIALDAKARFLGLQENTALADARSRLLSLNAVSYNPSADSRFIKKLADLALAFTPSVALDPPHGLALDITGCAHLFAGEPKLSLRLQDALQKSGISVSRLAVAPTPDMARALARFSQKSPCFVHDDQLVRALPVEALECPSEDLIAVKRAGLKTIADIADRPSVLFTARFTQNFTDKLACLLGEKDRRISPMRNPPPYRAEQRLAEPITSHPVISNILSELAATVSTKLSEKGEGGRVFEATFLRADGAVRRIRIETSRPTRDPAIILRLYQDRLQSLADPLDPGFGFDIICFEALRSEIWDDSQATLSASQSPDDEVANLVDRLTAKLGREKISQLKPANTHVPELAQSAVTASVVTGHSAKELSWQHMKSSLRPPVLFNPPRIIEVETKPDGQPALLRWHRMVHQLSKITGPERIAEEWWRSSPSPLYGTRDYYRVESASGQRFWIFQSRASSPPSDQHWFLHGLFP